MLKGLSSIQPDFDWQRLNQLADEDPDFATELLAMFLKDAESSLAKIDRAVEQRSHQIVEDVAHALRGASANVGANTMAAVAMRLEDIAGCAELSEAQGLLQLLYDQCKMLRTEITDKLRRS